MRFARFQGVLRHRAETRLPVANATDVLVMGHDGANSFCIPASAVNLELFLGKGP